MQHQCAVSPYSNTLLFPPFLCVVGMLVHTYVCLSHSGICFSLSATTAADDCRTLRILFEEAYQSGKRSYDSPYDWLMSTGSSVYLPQCLQNGTFATVQCSNASLPVDELYNSYRAKYCWCVDPATGIPTSTDYGYNTEPSPGDCPYYDTATLCQVSGMSLCSSISFLHSWHYCTYKVSH